MDRFDRACVTLRLGFMCGLYEPPGGSEQQSHGQLSHRICQNIGGVTHSDPSGGNTLHTMLYAYVTKCLNIKLFWGEEEGQCVFFGFT